MGMKHDGTTPTQLDAIIAGSAPGGDASSGYTTTPVTQEPPALPPETACTATASDEGSTLQPVVPENWNVKGQLLEKFGEHAVEWKHIPQTSFQQLGCDVPFPFFPFEVRMCSFATLMCR